MLTFKQSIQFIEADQGRLEELVEALTMSQRMAARRAFKKKAHKIKLGRIRAARKTASAEVLQKRARKAARTMIMKKISKNVDKEEMSFAQRQTLEKRLDKMRGKIDKIAKKLLPQMRKKERERKQAMQKSKS